MAGNLNPSSPSKLWEEKQLNLDVVRALLRKFPRLKLYSPEWKGGALYLVEKGVKDKIAGKGEWKVAKFKPVFISTTLLKECWRGRILSFGKLLSAKSPSINRGLFTFCDEII